MFFIKWHVMPGYLSFEMLEPWMFTTRDYQWASPFAYLRNTLKLKTFSNVLTGRQLCNLVRQHMINS